MPVPVLVNEVFGGNFSEDRKSTRLNSSHLGISYAVFCLKKKNDNFQLPIPMVKQKGKWFFDTKVGREEILNRRVGEHELNAIEICRGFDEAQHEYAIEK